MERSGKRAVRAALLAVLLIALIVLYFIGRRLQKKQEASQEQMEAAKQTVSMLAIAATPGSRPAATCCAAIAVFCAATVFQPRARIYSAHCASACGWLTTV